MNASDLAIGLIAPSLQLALLGILAWHKIHRRFPFFFVYTAYSIGAAAVLALSMLRFPTHYYEAYWTIQFIYGLLALMAIIEVFESVLRLIGFDGLGWRILLPCGILIIVAIALWQFLYHPAGRGPLVSFAAGSYAFELGVRSLQVGILLLCLAPPRRYGVLWHYDFSIVAGLGAAALFTLIADLAGLKLGGKFEGVFRYLPSGAYIAAASYWLLVFAKPEPPRPRLDVTIHQQLTMVRRLTALLKKYWNGFDSGALSSKMKDYIWKF